MSSGLQPHQASEDASFVYLPLWFKVGWIKTLAPESQIKFPSHTQLNLLRTIWHGMAREHSASVWRENPAPRCHWTFGVPLGLSQVGPLSTKQLTDSNATEPSFAYCPEHWQDKLLQLRTKRLHSEVWILCLRLHSSNATFGPSWFTIAILSQDDSTTLRLLILNSIWITPVNDIIAISPLKPPVHHSKGQLLGIAWTPLFPLNAKRSISEQSSFFLFFWHHGRLPKKIGSKWPRTCGAWNCAISTAAL